MRTFRSQLAESLDESVFHSAVDALRSHVRRRVRQAVQSGVDSAKQRVKNRILGRGWHTDAEVQGRKAPKNLAQQLFGKRKAITEGKEYVLWGIPKGQTDALHSTILYTQGKTLADVERIKKLAARDGWHSFRVQVLDLSKGWDVGAAFAKGVRRGR